MVTASGGNPNDKLLIAVSSVAKTFVGDLVEAGALVGGAGQGVVGGGLLEGRVRRTQDNSCLWEQEETGLGCGVWVAWCRLLGLMERANEPRVVEAWWAGSGKGPGGLVEAGARLGWGGSGGHGVVMLLTLTGVRPWEQGGQGARGLG